LQGQSADWRPAPVGQAGLHLALCGIGVERQFRPAQGPGKAAALSSGNAAPVSITNRCSQAWAMLIKRVYKIDPLTALSIMVKTTLSQTQISYHSLC
jgi:hypothetical protein